MRRPIRFTVAKDFLPIQDEPRPAGASESLTSLERARRFYERQFRDGTVEVEEVPGGLAVLWTPAEAELDPIGYSIELLQNGQLSVAVPMLRSLLEDRPDNGVILFNLGMAESDIGQLDAAITHLQALLAKEPAHAHGRIALGVAHARAGHTEEAMTSLREAVNIAPDDPYARRNLGALLGKQGLVEEAEIHLREAVRLLPSNQQALYGLAHTLLTRGGEERIAEADQLLERAIALEPESDVAEQCRNERSRIAHGSFRSAGGGQLRMDAVMYCHGAMQTFAKMSQEDIRKVTFEIAMLGTRGLDVNDSAQKYQLHSLPGRFSGLQLVSIEYVGFKIIDPGIDLGFDLAREYEQAQALYGSGGAQQA